MKWNQINEYDIPPTPHIILFIMEMEEEGDYNTYLCTTLSPPEWLVSALRWAAMRAILMFD